MTGPERYHLLVAVAGRPVQHGWWGNEVTARGRFPRWVGTHGSIPGARITLTDEETGTLLTEWPEGE